MVQPAENRSHLNEAWLCELSLAYPTCCGVGKDLSIFFLLCCSHRGLRAYGLQARGTEGRGWVRVSVGTGGVTLPGFPHRSQVTMLGTSW